MMADTQPAKKPKRSGLPPRRWFGFLFFTALAIGAGWLWHRSWQLADLGMYHLRDGSVHGILSHQGNLMLTTTTLSLGPDKAFTADFTTGPSGKDGAWLYEGAYVNASWRKSIWHFGMSAGRKGDVPEAPDLSWSTVVLPHGAVVIVSGILAIWCFWGGVMRPKLRRRLKRGECIHCGYDLRGTAGDTCPECGNAKPATAQLSPLQATTAAAGELRVTIRAATPILLTVLLFPAALWTVRLYAAPPSEAEQAATYAANCSAAGLHRPLDIPPVDVEETARLYLERITQQLGLRMRFVDAAPGSRVAGVYELPIEAFRLSQQRRTLAQTLDEVVVRQGRGWWELVGREIIISHDDPTLLARVYDVMGLRPPTLASRDPDFSLSSCGTINSTLALEWPYPTGPWRGGWSPMYDSWQEWQLYLSDSALLQRVTRPVHPGATAQFGGRAIVVQRRREQLAFAHVIATAQAANAPTTRP